MPGLRDESIGDDPHIFGEASDLSRDQILAGEQGTLIKLLSKIDELITEGKRIGNNLNQIARALNSDSFDPGITTDIRRALGDLAEWKYEILQEVGRAIGNDQTFELEKLGPRGRRALLDLSARREQQQTGS